MVELTGYQVSPFVQTFNEDGKKFIRDATRHLTGNNIYADITPKQPRSRKAVQPNQVSPVRIKCPEIFSHYVLNLPATALTFLPAFVGIYTSHEDLFEPHTLQKLPMVHVHCFNTKSDDNIEEQRKICKEITEHLGHPMKPGDPDKEGEVEIWDVRDVAPLKRMFCASFRLPKEVAFRKNLV